MSKAIHRAEVFELLLRMGDSCLVLGQRLCAWCGHAPALEEDIAQANTALDLIGQAQLWLGLAAEKESAGRTADDLAFLRDGCDYRNFLLVEQPNGDYGNTLMRQFLFDAWHVPMLSGLRESANQRIAAIAEKTAKEAAYHLQRSTDLVIHLGDGTDESHSRMQSSLDDLWPYTGELSSVDALDQKLIQAGITPPAAGIAQAWSVHVSATLAKAGLNQPDSGYMHSGGKSGIHSEHLGYLLAEMQFMQRAYPGSTW